jgi:alcohol dehydrogenase class IV
MVTEFKITGVPCIYFGPGKIKLLPEILKQYNGRILIVVSKFLATASAQIDQFESELNRLSLYYEFVYVHGEPTAVSVDQIVNSFRSNNIGVVCAIGGGSTIDTGKAISAMLKESGSIENYLEGIGSKLVSGAKVAFIAVPSTAGTGSEATKNAVISRIGPSGYKRSLRHDKYLPDIALIDPELCLNCPPEVTAASGMDAFTQLLEAFLSTNSNPFTDALALKGLCAVNDSLLPAFYDGNNLKARSDMSFAALVSGITLANAGLGVVHGFASSIGGYYDIPHGVICGTMLAEVNKANIIALMEQESKEQLEKIHQIALLFIPGSNLSITELLMKFSDLILEWTDLLKIPRLGTYGVNKSNIEQIVRITDLKYNPVKFSNSALTKILLNRI